MTSLSSSPLAALPLLMLWVPTIRTIHIWWRTKAAKDHLAWVLLVFNTIATVTTIVCLSNNWNMAAFVSGICWSMAWEQLQMIQLLLIERSQPLPIYVPIGCTIVTPVLLCASFLVVKLQWHPYGGKILILVLVYSGRLVCFLFSFWLTWGDRAKRVFFMIPTGVHLVLLAVHWVPYLFKDSYEVFLMILHLECPIAPVVVMIAIQIGGVLIKPSAVGSQSLELGRRIRAESDQSFVCIDAQSISSASVVGHEFARLDSQASVSLEPEDREILVGLRERHLKTLLVQIAVTELGLYLSGKFVDIKVVGSKIADISLAAKEANFGEMGSQIMKEKGLQIMETIGLLKKGMLDQDLASKVQGLYSPLTEYEQLAKG